MDVLLIDGYNVLYAAYQELMEDLGHARERLASDLSEYAAAKGVRAVLVYDAHSAIGAEKRYEVSCEGLQIVYTSEGETADSFIEKHAYQLVRQGERVFVVTSDRMEQTIALGTGAYRVTARELALQIKQVKQKLRADAQSLNLYDRSELAGRLKEDVVVMLDKLRRNR